MDSTQMDKEQKFYLKMVGFVIIGAVLIALVIGGSCSYQYYKTAEVIKSGINPVAAKYAFSHTSQAEDALAWMSMKSQLIEKGGE